jgi:hypothetical protein
MDIVCTHARRRAVACACMIVGACVGLRVWWGRGGGRTDSHRDVVPSATAFGATADSAMLLGDRGHLRLLVGHLVHGALVPDPRHKY